MPGCTDMQDLAYFQSPQKKKKRNKKNKSTHKYAGFMISFNEKFTGKIRIVSFKS